MRRFGCAALAAVVVLGVAPVASAAPPVYSWTGFYVGGNIGYGWGDAKTDIAGSGTTIFLGLIPNNYAFAGTHTQKPDGVIGGGQFGYNYQYSPKWLIGFEADIQGSDQRKSSTLADLFGGPLCTGHLLTRCTFTVPLIGAAVTGYEAKIDWFGTVRGRIGWLVTDQTLLYATGGLAYGHVSVSGNLNVSSSTLLASITFGPGTTSAFSASKTNAGFAVGGGIEGKFTAWLPQNLSWKLEYLYMDLGSLDTSTPFAAVSNDVFRSPLAGTMTTHARFTDNIVRVGINYQFGR